MTAPKPTPGQFQGGDDKMNAAEMHRLTVERKGASAMTGLAKGPIPAPGQGERGEVSAAGLDALMAIYDEASIPGPLNWFGRMRRIRAIARAELVKHDRIIKEFT